MADRYITIKGNELYHHGILGQKWGVRRFQTYSGALTPEGRARYYNYNSDSEKRKLADAAKDSMNNDRRGIKDRAKIKEHPIIQDAAQEIADAFAKSKEADKKYWNEVDKFYSNKKVYEMYLNKAVDHFMEEVGPEWGTREEAYNWFKFDDGDQGSYSSLQLYENSPEGKSLKEARESMAETYKNAAQSCKDYISEYLGAYGDEVVNPGSNYERTVKARLTDFVMDVAEKNYEASNRWFRRGALDSEKSREAHTEKEDGTNPEKYSTESYKKLRKGKYKDLADTLDQEITEKRDEAQKAWDVYVDSGKHFFQFQKNKEERKAAKANFNKAYNKMSDEFFSISEKYIKEHFTKEQWDDARAFVYDHLGSSDATYIEMD